MTIIVYGLPGPQGSKSFKGMSKRGHAILAESSKKVRPWRQDVVAAVHAQHPNHIRFVGPVRAVFIFTLPKPKSAPKRRKTVPDRAPDTSKLVRSTEDALTTAGVWEDDARVVESASAKRYPNEGLGALPSPGCLIIVEPLKMQ